MQLLLRTGRACAAQIQPGLPLGNWSVAEKGKLSDSQESLTRGLCDLTSFPRVWAVTAEHLLLLFPGGVRAGAVGAVPSEGSTPQPPTLFLQCIN